MIVHLSTNYQKMAEEDKKRNDNKLFEHESFLYSSDLTILELMLKGNEGLLMQQ